MTQFNRLSTLNLALETKSVAESGVFEGYASTFGNVDQGGDVIERGAFAASMAKAKAERRTVPMLWQHDQREPIGVWQDMQEDAKGLFVRGKLLLAADPLARRAHSLLKEGGLGGMSIGYVVPKGGARPDPSQSGVMRLSAVELREISLVTMPMNLEARFTAVKSFATTRDFARFLREVGVPRAAADRLAAGGFPALAQEPETTLPKHDWSGLTRSMRAATDLLKKV